MQRREVRVRCQVRGRRAGASGVQLWAAVRGGDAACLRQRRPHPPVSLPPGQVCLPQQDRPQGYLHRRLW